MDSVTSGITHTSLARLRAAIRARELSFPAQVPTFPRQSRADIQWRLVILYFVRGWSCSQLARRYGLTSRRIGQLLSHWVEEATLLGYVEEIPAEAAITSSAMRDARAA